MKRFRMIITLCALLLSVGVAAAPAYADDTGSDPKSTVCSTLGSDSSCGTTPGNSVDVNNIVSAVINILSAVVGIAAVIMIIIGGLRMITANGDSNSINIARTSIIWSLVGLVIVAVAQFIVRFVLSKATSST